MNGGYELKRTDAKGEGVFATRSFRVGETVMVGVIDCELDHNHAHASQVGEKRFVLHGGLITKVNHSCDPNCGIHLNADGAHDYVARRAITPGQEITFDYAMRNYSVEHFAAHCQCGSPRCRDHITGWRGLSAERKADYHGFVAPYLTAIDDRLATQQADQGRADGTGSASTDRPDPQRRTQQSPGHRPCHDPAGRPGTGRRSKGGSLREGHDTGTK